MAVLQHTYLEAHDSSSNKHAYYLALLIQEGPRYKTLGYYGRVGNAHAVTSKYDGPSAAAAKAAFDKVVWDKGHKRSPDPSYLPANMPANFTAEIARLNQQNPAAPSAPAKSAAPVPTPTAPRAPAAPFPLPEAVVPRAADAATYAAALSSPAWIATPVSGEPVFVVIPARGQAQLVARERFPQPDSLNRFPALVAALDPANPVLADSIFAAEVVGRGASLRLWDLLTYRGTNLRGFPLSERLSLLYQAFNELAREGQLSLTWSLAECLNGSDKSAEASKKTDMVLRDLGAFYVSTDPNAALRRAADWP